MCGELVSNATTGAVRLSCKSTHANAVDEVWDASSDDAMSTADIDCSDSELESEPEAAVHAGNRGRVVVPKASHGVPAASMPRMSQPATSSCINVTSAGMQSFPCPAGNDGLISLLSKLRTDNTRLRHALIEAQREAEAVAFEQELAGKAEAKQPGIDFGYLLALARDFGDGLGGGLDLCGIDDLNADGASADFATDDLISPKRDGFLPLGEGSVQVFAMDSPRGSCGECSEAESAEAAKIEVEERLRKELAASQEEVAHLRRQLGVRDEEIMAAFAA